jgi:hypothetical protein
MTLYDRSVDLQLKLEAAQSADTSMELLSRAGRLIEALEQSAAYLEGVARFREAANVVERPKIDVRAVTRAVSVFRAGVSQHGSAAFQHQPATSLADTAKKQRELATRWLTAVWRDTFAEYEPLMDRVDAEHLVGSSSHRVVAQARVSKLRALRGFDPVANAAGVDGSLGTIGDVRAWITAIRGIGAELRDALAALDTERESLTPEVRDALERAASDAGFPLDEVTHDLLGALRHAGVDEHLVVRKR